MALLRRAGAFVVAGWLAAGGFAHAAGAAGEYEVKAAFLYNFAKFVTWPERAFATSDEPLRFCILEKDPFGESLDDTVKGRTIGSREISIRRLETLETAPACHVLFVPSSAGFRAEEIAGGLGNRSVLTVGETADFAREGGVVNFRMEEQRVRFEINRGAAKRAGLKLAAQLLKLATIVSDAHAGDER